MRPLLLSIAAALSVCAADSTIKKVPGIVTTSGGAPGSSKCTEDGLLGFRTDSPYTAYICKTGTGWQTLGGGASTVTRQHVWQPTVFSSGTYPPAGVTWTTATAMGLTSPAGGGSMGYPSWTSTHNGGNVQDLIARMRIPDKWDGSTFTVYLQSSGDTASSVAVMGISTYCYSTTSNQFPTVSWNTETTSNFTGGSNFAGTRQSFTPAMTGCSAGNHLLIRWRRVSSNGSDTNDSAIVYTSMLTAEWVETIP